MVRSTTSDRRAKLLEHANLDWSAVHENAVAFLQLPHVMKALGNDEYRTTVWLQDSAYVLHAERLLRDLNQAQKMVDEQTGQVGMLPLSLMMEQFNLLLTGSTLQTKSTLRCVYFNTENQQQTSIGIIKVIYAVQIQLFVTYGALQPHIPDRLVTETHGLHTVVECSNHVLLPVLPRYNTMASEDQLRSVYSYSNPTERILFNLIKGARFRCLKLCEFCDETRRPFVSGQVATTIVTEVVTHTALVKNGIRPIFFAGQFGIGPTFEHTIDITAEDARRQIQVALPHIYEVIESSVIL